MIDAMEKELMDRVEKAELVYRLKNQKEWQVFKEVADRIAENAIRKLVYTKADDMVAIIELQVVIRKYKFALFSEIKQIIEEGKTAIDAITENDLLDKRDIT